MREIIDRLDPTSRATVWRGFMILAMVACFHLWAINREHTPLLLLTAAAVAGCFAAFFRERAFAAELNRWDEVVAYLGGYSVLA